MLAAGTCTIEATQAGDSKYAAAPLVSHSIAVHLVSQTINFPAIATQTHGNQLTLTATASSGLAVTFSSTTTAVCTVSGQTAKMLAAGSCTIVASQAGDSVYASATASHTFTVK